MLMIGATQEQASKWAFPVEVTLFKRVCDNEDASSAEWEMRKIIHYSLLKMMQAKLKAQTRTSHEEQSLPNS